MAPARFKIYAERYGKLLPAGENSARQRNESAFSGTPCQVAGLRSFLKKITITFTVWTSFVTACRRRRCFWRVCGKISAAKRMLTFSLFAINERVEQVAFAENFGRRQRADHRRQNYPYMASFLKNLCLRPSCGRCRFNRLPRQGDLTVGDFWLVDNVDSRLNDDKGTSVILVNNEKGRRLLDAAAAKFKLLEKAPLEKAVDGNPNIVASSRHNPARDVFSIIGDG